MNKLSIALCIVIALSFGFIIIQKKHYNKKLTLTNTFYKVRDRNDLLRTKRDSLMAEIDNHKKRDFLTAEMNNHKSRSVSIDSVIALLAKAEKNGDKIKEYEALVTLIRIRKVLPNANIQDLNAKEAVILEELNSLCLKTAH